MIQEEGHYERERALKNRTLDLLAQLAAAADSMGYVVKQQMPVRIVPHKNNSSCTTRFATLYFIAGLCAPIFNDSRHLRKEKTLQEHESMRVW